jgi:hypothetical protein
MVESLDNIKKTLEDHLQKIDFIYSGDVIKSESVTFVNSVKDDEYLFFIKNMLVGVYDWSFDKMEEKSKEIIIHRDKFIDVYDLIDKISINPKLMFFSKNSNLNLNLGDSNLLEMENDGYSYFPNYFNRRFKLMSSGVEVSAYYSPKIEDDVDDCHFYLVDKPIQSMVWSLQNMTYKINKGLISNEHVIKMPIYYCDYIVYKIRVIDTQKIREDKINSILNEN